MDSLRRPKLIAAKPKAGARNTRPVAPTKPDLATKYFRRVSPGVWAIRGAGAIQGGLNGMHPRLNAVLKALERDNILVESTSYGSAANADSYTFSAQFDDGGLSVKTGNYMFGHRGGSITGPLALSRMIRLLGLRLPQRTARAWGLVGAPDLSSRDGRAPTRVR